VQPGKVEIITLILIFVGLQAWWIIPIIKRNKRDKDLNEEVKQLEKIFKK
tara:strand:- start:174 stop:323 length:150 start_codon:yes stop_codon:yes gene_type:complete